jgi:tRNA 2-thiocytidine biosynthesis protein TtcA
MKTSVTLPNSAPAQKSPLPKLKRLIGKAIADFHLIQSGDRILVGLSGGKDSFTLLYLLHQLQKKSPVPFELMSFTLDQAQPGYDDSGVRNWLEVHNIPFTIVREDTYSIVTQKLSPGQTYCSLCSRLRRGVIYNYAHEHNYNKIALGHHREDLIHSVLMSMLYSGSIESMPPKLRSDDGRNTVIRPLAYCPEDVIASFATEMKFPIIPCNLCGSQENLKRKKVATLVKELTADNSNVPGNLLNALQNVNVTQLMDKRHRDFKNI